MTTATINPPWIEIARPLVTAEDALARLDERPAKRPIREGWSARTHFFDAAACVWLDGRLAPLEDLVLHDARMDVRAPTHALTRAQAALRARRRIAAGRDALRGRAGGRGPEPAEAVPPQADAHVDAADSEPRGGAQDLAALFASLNAAIVHVDQTLSGRSAPPPGERDVLVYDLDWDEEARLNEWRDVVERTRTLPPTLAAAIAPLQHAPWLGRLLVGALLNQRGKSRAHPPCLNEGLKAIPSRRRRPDGGTGRLAVEIEATAAAAEAGLRRHDRRLTARALLPRKLDGRRSTSRLPALVDLLIARLIVTDAIIAWRLRVTPRAK